MGGKDFRSSIGVPLRSEGQLTVKAPAEEAGLRRNKLTHEHTRLKDLLRALLRDPGSAAGGRCRHRWSTVHGTAVDGRAFVRSLSGTAYTNSLL